MPPRHAGASTLKHLPFFEVLASVDERSEEAKRATAGLLTLRMLDHWVLAGPAIVEPESVSVRSVRQAIMALGKREPAREVLLAIVNTMQMLRQVDMVPVLPRVFAYGQLLERHYSQFALAADAFATIVRYAEVELDADLVMDSYYRLGYCERSAGALDRADEAYEQMGRVATRRKDRARALRSRNGLGVVLMLRGDYGAADATLAEVGAQAAKAGLVAEQSMALHNRAVVASKVGDFERATLYAHGALGLCQDSGERERVLFDLGAFLLESGRIAAARDAFTIVELTATSDYFRNHARGNLAICAARFGTPDEVESSLGRVDVNSLRADARVALAVEMSAAYGRFGNAGRAAQFAGEATRLTEALGLADEPAIAVRIQTARAVAGKHQIARDVSDAGRLVETDLQTRAAEAVASLG